MANQIVVSAGAKVRNLSGVLTATSGVVSFLPIDVSLGIPQLDINGKILVSQLPNSVMEYKGTWSAATNTPTLANGTGNQGDVYLCNVAGTVDFGAGSIAFVVGDQVIYSGSIWQRASGATGTVTSVAITESGDSLNITGSPITTSGTINIGFNGTNLQYVNGAGNLTTFPILTGFVPYTGATGAVDLGANGLTALSLTLSDSIYLNNNKPIYGKNFAGTLSYSLLTITTANKVLIDSSALGAEFGGSILINGTISKGIYTYTLPNATGTIALTSDIPILTGYVPYTGATANVDLGTFNLTADVITGATGSFASNGGSDTFAINHSSGAGIALNITKGGNGEGLYINKTSGSGNAATIIGTLNATTLVKSGGTSSQFLKADGTVDSSTYALDSAVVHNTGNETVGGTKTFSDATKNNGGIFLQNASSNSLAGYMNLGGLTNGVKFTSGGGISNTFTLPSATGYTFTFPNATGTIALTSDIPSLTGYVNTSGSPTTNTLPKFTSATTIGNSNITDSGSLITLGSNTTISSGSLGIGSAGLSTYSLRVAKSLTGATTMYGISSEGTIQSDVTTSAIAYLSGQPTAAAAFTLNGYYHFYMQQGSIGAGSAITNQFGLFVDSTLVGATNNYGVFLGIPSGTGRWNLYASGTANNYMAGSLGIGTTSLTGRSLSVSKNITGATTSYAIRQDGIIQSDVTTDARGYHNSLSTAASAFTLANYYHYIATQGTIGGGSAVTNQYGFVVDSLTGATNNYAFFSNIGASANRWNLYMGGTAANYMAGVLNIGTTTLSGYTLDVNGTGRFVGAITAAGALFTAATETRGNIRTTFPSDNSYYSIFSNDGALNLDTYGVGGYMNFKILGSTKLSIASTGAATFSGLITGQNGIYQSNASSSIASNKFETYNGGATDMNFSFPASGSVTFTNGTPRLTIASTGAATFSSSVTANQIFSTTTAAGYAAILTNTNGASDSNGLLVKASSVGTEYVVRFANQTDTSTFFTIKGTGNVLIGTTTDSGYKLDVNGTGRFSGGDSSNCTLKIQASTYPMIDFISNDADSANNRNWRLAGVYNAYGTFEILSSTTQGGVPTTSRFSINGVTGAATFSSSVTAGGTIKQTSAVTTTGATAEFYNASSSGYGMYIQAGTTTNYSLLVTNYLGSNAFQVLGNGAGTFYGSVTATSFFESSSIKGKDIIATNPLLALDIDVIKYTRKSDESKDIRYGYSAEQIHSLMPELTDKDVTAVKYLDVHTILIANLQKEIRELKAKINN